MRTWARCWSIIISPDFDGVTIYRSFSCIVDTEAAGVSADEPETRLLRREGISTAPIATACGSVISMEAGASSSGDDGAGLRRKRAEGPTHAVFFTHFPAPGTPGQLVSPLLLGKKKKHTDDKLAYVSEMISCC